MVLPDDILEAVDALPLEESWDLIRSYLDEGGDIDDLSADGITILNHFLTPSRGADGVRIWG